jgi:hypothetical protein
MRDEVLSFIAQARIMQTFSAEYQCHLRPQDTHEMPGPVSALPPFKTIPSAVCAWVEGHIVWSKALICSGALN